MQSSGLPRSRKRLKSCAVLERITTSCPAAVPVSLAQRLNAIVDRIWAMHDALLTIRLPFERFYDALSEE